MEQKRGRIYQHFRSFLRVLDTYPGNIPLSRFLTGFFKENKQMGSKDRRMVSSMVYHYFRLGKACANLDVLNRLVLAEFLCATESELVRAERPDLSDRMHLELEEKIEILKHTDQFDLENVFPFVSLSDQIDPFLFTKQFLIQPDLFIRIRSGQEHVVRRILEKHEITYDRIADHTLVLPNGTSINQIRALNGLVEIQDLSSQKSLDSVTASDQESWWDVCSGAGGKALLFLDKYPKVNLLVSDMRASVLRNLDERFDAAGITNYRKKIIDLEKSDLSSLLGQTKFDGIILDAPCTGSGTWGRTPEMMSSFDPKTILYFSSLQKRIASRTISYLKQDRELIYITCSAFSEENEVVVDYLCARHNLNVNRLEYIRGYEHKADTMFVAHLLKK